MKKIQRGEKIEKVCRCGALFLVRVAEVKRGWGKFFSKSCKATEQNIRLAKSSANNEPNGFHGADDVFYTGQGWG